MDEYVTTFRIVADFPAGVLVAQDGHNRAANQNFKLVRWDLSSIVGNELAASPPGRYRPET